MFSRVDTLADVALVSEVLSVRTFLHNVFGGPDTDPPGPPILLHRDATVQRPFWRIDDSNASTLRRMASGWEDGDRQVNIIYAGVDAIDTKRAISKARDWFMRWSSIPFYFRDGAWFRPMVDVNPDPAGPVLPAGNYSVRVTAVDYDGAETLPSDVFAFTLDEAKAVVVRCPMWPYQAPIAKSYRAYLSTAGSPHVLSNEADIPSLAVGWAPVPLVTPTVDTLPPTTCKVYGGTIGVDYTQVQVFDSLTVDGEYDGVLSLHLSRPLWTHINLEGVEGYRPYAAEDLTVSILL